MRVVFLETAIFTEDLRRLLGDDQYGAFQAHLVARPDSGDLIPGAAGARKVRWGARGRGKRGGVRVIYYYAEPVRQIRLLMIYAKAAQDDLSPAQAKAIAAIVARWKMLDRRGA